MCGVCGEDVRRQRTDLVLPMPRVCLHGRQVLLAQDKGPQSELGEVGEVLVQRVQLLVLGRPLQHDVVGALNQQRHLLVRRPDHHGHALSRRIEGVNAEDLDAICSGTPTTRSPYKGRQRAA